MESENPIVENPKFRDIKPAEIVETLPVKHAGGRPLKYESPELLEEAINSYFKKCEDHKEDELTMIGVLQVNRPLIPTIAGLASHIGTDRMTIYNYANRDEFIDIIKNARNRIMGEIESGVVNGDKNPGGKIFVMKNYGYSDKQEIEFVKPLIVEVRDYRGRHFREQEALKNSE